MYNGENQRYSTLEMRDKTFIILDSKHSFTNKSFAVSPKPVIIQKRSKNRKPKSSQRKCPPQLPKVHEKRGFKISSKKTTFHSRMNHFKKNMKKTTNIYFRNIRKSQNFNRSIERHEGKLTK
mmetsp:Transcript_20114/g.19750  ORF Transcript_20114/g.19750 Transcript_20114/m.19750 type:complete len:122 (-) Transcript_20114:200-565(-)